MTVLGPSNSRKIRLGKLAHDQYGYFLATQAVKLGYTKDNHFYHVKSQNWLRIEPGLFRLPGYSDTLESDFARWYLWSRNQEGQPQGVVSHHSALKLRGLGDYDPEHVHLTVPGTFRKSPPAGCVLHKADLNLSVIEVRHGFLVTRMARTLADLRDFLDARGEWAQVVTQAVESGYLSREEARNFEPRLPAVGFCLPAWAEGHESRPEAATPAIFLAPEPSADEKTAVPNLMRERIYKMIFQRTQAGANSRRRAQAGFTLVELLVVTAIISILAGMLLPALEKTLETARGTLCVNNQKQIGVIFSTYLDMYNFWPSALWWPTPPDYGKYDTQFYNAGLMGKGEGLNSSWPASQPHRINTYPAGIWRCPKGEPVKVDWGGTYHYAMNGHSFQNRFLSASYTLKYPSRLTIHADTDHAGYYSTITYPGTPSLHHIMFRHGRNLAAFLFADLHGALHMEANFDSQAYFIYNF